MPKKLALAGEPIPAGLSSKAKAVGNLVTGLIGLATTTAALNLIPDDVVTDEQVIGAGFLLTSVVTLIVTYLVPNKLTEEITVGTDPEPGA